MSSISSVRDTLRQDRAPNDKSDSDVLISAWDNTIDARDEDGAQLPHPPDNGVVAAAVPGAVPSNKARGKRGRATGPVGTIPAGAEGAEDRPSEHALPRVGDRFHQYEIIRELGRGGMGAVYLARDVKLARRVAIKFLLSNNPRLTDRFIAEARVTARCSHENIVVIHDVNQYRGNPFMVFEYLKGRQLRQVIAGRALPAQRAVDLMVPVVRALVCAHEQKIVHRDLKPENIFLTDAGTIKVLDFGVAKFNAQSGVHELPSHGAGPGATPDSGPYLLGHDTNPGALVGTILYMAPEQRCGGAVDHRADIWAVGLLLYEMVTGSHPLASLDRETLLNGVPDALLIPDIRRAKVPLPDSLVDVIERCLIVDPKERIGSARELLELLEPLWTERHDRRLRGHQSPYPGLLSFQESDSDRYFGRSRDIADMLTRVRNQPLVGVIGPTGIGKSSFVRAGIIPALKRSGESWEVLIVRPGRHPLASIASMLLPLVNGTNSSPLATGANTETITDSDHGADRHAALVRRLEAEPGYLGALLRSRAHSRGGKILLVVDPFEELYTLTAELSQRRAFTACLAGVADDAAAPLRVIVSLRSDFLDRVAEDRHFMGELTAGLMLLPPPDRRGLEEALTQPAEMAGYQFESHGMVRDIIDAVEATPGSLPLLQFAAAKLWEARDIKRRLLTKASYDEIGGIVGALTSHADDVVSTIGRMSPRAPAIVQAIFQHLVTHERTRAIAAVDELRSVAEDPAEIQQVIDHLVDARLLVVQSGDDGDGATIEIVHDSLIHSWPRLRRWLDENEEDAAILQQLRTAAKQWDAKGRPQGLLWRGETMEEARRWHQRFAGSLAEVQKDYLRAAFALADRTTRLWRLAITGTIIFLLCLVAAAAVALVWIRNAERRATELASATEEARQELQRKVELLQQKEKELFDTNAKVTDSRDKLGAALKEAEEAKQRAEQARLRAEAEEQRARQALIEVQMAQKLAEEAARKAMIAAESERAARIKLEEEEKRRRERERRSGRINETLTN